VRSNVIASEERLEKIIQARLDILGLDDLFQIGRQVITDFGKRIDLLAIDGRGDLYVIELKRDRTPREVVAQALGAEPTDPDIRFLALSELEALLRAARELACTPTQGESEPDVRALTDHALYLTAAMTGLREGELVALRRRDVDWSASVIRVRRNYTRGRLGTPKSKRSSRALPMADRLGGELDCHFKRSLYQGDDHLVFCHPQTGEPYDASQISQAVLRDDGGRRDGAGLRARGRNHLPLAAAHVRDAHGGGRGADAHPAGVDGASQPRDDRNLCGRCPRSGLWGGVRGRRVHGEAGRGGWRESGRHG
jgi:hypothetical protein